ncbi:mitochondrial carrier domain-containing protein [Cladochytrium replicatum]|nr:mitochondrial carrier domain-containing protein [Cladochytrium replicatum]
MADPTQLVPPLFYVFSASVAALVSRVLTHPLDTLRVRAQSETEYHPKRSPTTLLALLRNVIVNEGFSALYRGITVVLIFSVPALITYIGTYDTSKPIIAGILRLDVTSAWVHLLCGAIAEIASAVFWTPMEVIKSRQQVVLNDFGQSESVVVVTKRLIQQEGYSGLFKGYLLGVGVYVPQSITYFVVYEQLKMAFAAVLFPGVYPLPTATLPSWAVLISATIASAAGKSIAFAEIFPPIQLFILQEARFQT